MSYRQITFAERYTLGLLHRQGQSPAAIGRVLGRHRSTIHRELQRNAATADGGYRPRLAQWYANGRRRKSRRNSQFGPAAWQLVESLVRDDWSPEQIAGRLRRDRTLAISHETIYRHIWADRHAGGDLYGHLRGAQKAAPQTLWPLRRPRPFSWQAADHHAPRGGGRALACRRLGS